MKSILLTLCVVSLLTACAKTPSSITPMAVASSEYDGLSCKQLTTEFAAISEKLEQFEKKQRDKVAGDAVGVFLVLVPVSAMTGDFEADVARYKGEKIALSRAMDRKGCK